MKGFKGMKYDAKRGLYCSAGSRPSITKYKVGETAALKGTSPIRICKRGLHFCTSLPDVFRFYSLEYSFFTQVTAVGKIELGRGNKACTDLLKIEKLLTGVEVLKLLRYQKVEEGKKRLYVSGTTMVGGTKATYIFNTPEARIKFYEARDASKALPRYKRITVNYISFTAVAKSKRSSGLRGSYIVIL
jgi:hypothetical protein